MMIKIEVPEQVVQALKLPSKDAKQELIKLLALKLYEKGILGSGKARELAGVSKLQFFSLLKEEGVDLNYDIEELEEDLKQVGAISH